LEHVSKVLYDQKGKEEEEDGNNNENYQTGMSCQILKS